MMINKAFEIAEKENRLAIVSYFTAGFPNVEESYRVFLAMANAGADVIEIGIPFSDPLADGPTIQYSSSIALSKGINTDIAFDIAKRLSQKTDVPLVIMTYYNILMGYGLEKFIKNAIKNNIKGIIIPDMPPEESSNVQCLSNNELDIIFLTAPTSGLNRIKKITDLSKGFIYCVSHTGVTGAKEDKINKDTMTYVKNVKKLSNLPVAVGFGISSASQAKQLKGIADGIIVGSAFIKLYRKAGSSVKGRDKIANLIKNLRSA